MNPAAPRPPVFIAPSDQWVVAVLSRRQIEQCDLDPVVESLDDMVADRPTIEKTAGTVCFLVDGYNDDARELYEIPEVRTAFSKLEQRCPWWLHLVRPDFDDGMRLWFTTRLSIVVHSRGPGDVLVECADPDELNSLIDQATSGMLSLYRAKGLPESWIASRLQATTEAIRASL